MSSLLLNHDREEHGLAGRINRDFDRLKNFYGRVLDWTLARRPMVYTVWIGLTLLAVPMFSMAWQAKEPAPTEDQGVIFGVVETPPDATIEQISFYADVAGTCVCEGAGDRAGLSTHDAGHAVSAAWCSSRGASGSGRVFQILPEVQAMVNSIPGIRMFMVTPPPLPTGGENFPVNLILSSTAEPEQILEFAQKLQHECATNGMFAFPPQIDTKVDQPEVELVIDRDKVAALGLDMQTRRLGSGRARRRQLCEPL